MDIGRLLMMILNPILRRLISRGVDAGFDRVLGPRDKASTGDRQGRDAAKRLRQTLRIGRKLW